jgi:hypothetical protein
MLPYISLKIGKTVNEQVAEAQNFLTISKSKPKNLLLRKKGHEES